MGRNALRSSSFTTGASSSPRRSIPSRKKQSSSQSWRPVLRLPTGDRSRMGSGSPGTNGSKEAGIGMSLVAAGAVSTSSLGFSAGAAGCCGCSFDSGAGSGASSSVMKLKSSSPPTDSSVVSSPPEKTAGSSSSPRTSSSLLCSGAGGDAVSAVASADASEGRVLPGLRTRGARLGRFSLRPRAGDDSSGSVGAFFGETASVARRPLARLTLGLGLGLTSVSPRTISLSSGLFGSGIAMAWSRMALFLLRMEL
mmetsp:Transcript_25075/g.78645  ORF Transcript_25075/g.78645 Transcript_25075/m.78645 type:complete len:253 (-) Transcript_25075:103-861(-)